VEPVELMTMSTWDRVSGISSKLTGWHLDVNSESRYSEAMKSGYDSLVELPGVGISMADALYEKGFFSAEELSQADIEDLVTIRGIGQEKAVQLIESAIQQLERLAAEDAENEALPQEELESDDTNAHANEPEDALAVEDAEDKDD
jgi:N utilization substance protein A